MSYTNGFEFEVTSGQATCVELPAHPRGTVQRFSVKQTSWALAGFTANLLDRQDACSEVSEVSSSFESALDFAANKLLDKDMHRVLAQITVPAASQLSEQFQLAAGYQNRDEQDIRRTPNSRLYLEVLAAGAGIKTFQVSYNVLAWQD